MTNAMRDPLDKKGARGGGWVEREQVAERFFDGEQIGFVMVRWRG